MRLKSDRRDMGCRIYLVCWSKYLVLCGTPHYRPRHLRLIHLGDSLVGNRERWPIDIPSTAFHDIELPVGPADTPLAERIARHALDRHAFEDVVVHLLVMLLHRHLARGFPFPTVDLGIP